MRNNSESKIFVPGQKWSYKTRPKEEKSYLLILKVDDRIGYQPIIHIAIQGLEFKNPFDERVVCDEIPHLPFSKDALDQSALEIIENQVELPNFEAGYNKWKEEFSKGQAGIFSISVAKVIDFVEQTILDKD